MSEKLLSWPAPERNKGPILEVLKSHLPDEGLVLEIASGSGQHAAHFAPAFPALRWQPSDPKEEHRDSILAWRDNVGCANLIEPLELDTRHENWGVDAAAAIVCFNMIHISPWQSCLGLFRGAAELLENAGPLILYGPFKIDGRHTAASNARFSENLQRQSPEWGVRDLTEVSKIARENGFAFDDKVDMPANNMTVVYRKT